MIENINLANEGAYDTSGTKLEGLKKLNFVFGSNGSGKTTISRVVEGSGTFPDCQITWAGGSKLETRVYNKDFIEKHFDAESSIKGIYTFGVNVEVAEKIKILKGDADAIKVKLSALRKNLIGEDGESGKKKEREALDTQLLLDVWDAKGNFSDLKDAFAGLNSDKKKFRDHYLVEASNNAAELREINENPIKSSYELLWREVRQNPPSDTAIQNVTRRILEHYFKFYGGITPEAIIDSFEGKDKMVCNSLLSWINDGSHFAPDDLYLACDFGQIGRYLTVFQRIFEESGHGGHYKMMMGDDYVPLPLEIIDDDQGQAPVEQEVDGA